MTATTRQLYHFTCADHGEPGIRRERRVRPNWHPFFAGRIAWFTDDPAPEPEAVGLTSEIQPCDRMAFRVTIPDNPAIIPWTDIRSRMPIGPRNDLEMFGEPDRWFVAAVPVPAGDIVRRPRNGWEG